jgi:hypothetical protein
MRPYPLFSLNSLIVRLLFAFMLVFGTYNPSGRSYVHWLTAAEEVSLLWRVTVGIMLLVVLRTVVIIVWRALGIYGSGSFLLVALLVAASTASVHDFDGWAMQMMALSLLALYFGFGLSWSGMLYRLSRQVQSFSIGQARSLL